MKILGCLVNTTGVKLNPDNIRVVKEFPALCLVGATQTFVGLCSHFCCSVRYSAALLVHSLIFLKIQHPLLAMHTLPLFPYSSATSPLR